MDIINFVGEHMYIVIPVCWIIGAVIKKTEKIPCNFIPAILVTFGAVFGVAMLGLNVNGIMQGILCGGASVGIHQIKRQYDMAKDGGGV